MESAETALPGSTEVEGRPTLALLGKENNHHHQKLHKTPKHLELWGGESRRLRGGARQRASAKMGPPASGPLGVCESRCLFFRQEL